MKKINENTKITLTVGQLRKLVSESTADTIDDYAYKLWVAFINKFGVEETAKILSSYQEGYTSSAKLKLDDIIGEYEGEPPTEDVFDVLNSKASELGLSDDSTYPYSCYVPSKYDMFLYDQTRDSSYMYVGYKYDIINELSKALSNNDRVYLLISDGVAEEFRDDTLMWDDAIDALREKFNVLSEGPTKRENKQYAILADK